MAQNTLYVLPPSPRSVLILALAKYLKIDVDVVDITKSKDEKFTKAFPLGKAPAFIGENGFKLHEVIAIAYYCMSIKIFFSSEVGYHMLSSSPPMMKLYVFSALIMMRTFQLYSYPCLNG